MPSTSVQARGEINRDILTDWQRQCLKVVALLLSMSYSCSHLAQIANTRETKATRLGI